MKVSELLAHARDELYKGWTKGALAKGQNVCAVGALRRATMGNIQNGSTRVFKEARTLLNVKAREMAADVGIDWEFDGVEQFNDWSGTTHDDMLNLFDKTIIGAEEKSL